ncbi:MAG: peptidoglycan DD-metalloendopeptidase family protein [Bacilli bacterium]|nr:peptidoglycan DD-metalloendopeptidase family protein [Bacilli bacterium]MDD3304916.1 peptidoglycan DD-metalloendopeptidase family protein [Bacilli bacterium]MDD4053736.1 peptidoglycan DD-metalloendopeptidase family protein [Bacilli bacterium]MDD4411603.1 peptidoglycan DD-metalloendopeptidase family protein [Bacilli bacterium]
MLKRGFRILLICALLCNCFYVPNVYAKTVGDLENELNQKEVEANETETNIKQTEQQIANTRSNINQSYKDIDRIQNEMIAATKEIESLNQQIKDKDAETKELVSVLQISEGNNEYLEYIAGSKTMTDFIYRISITEQLVDYNKTLIADMNQMIVNTEAKKVELNNKEAQLKQMQVTLANQLNSLGSKREDLEDYSQSISEEIKIAKEVLDIYIKAGCKSSDDISTCANKILPPDTKFWRPLANGYVTSEYGYRDLYGKGSYAFHYALDLSSTNKYASQVFASANGKVVKVLRSSTGGGNQVIIHHNIQANGKSTKYTTYYCHLASISVKAGDVVSKNTVIGIMGSTGNSTGPHLHFSIAYGYWYTDYSSYYTFTSKTVNPRLLINFPDGTRNTWVNRTTAYK